MRGPDATRMRQQRAGEIIAANIRAERGRCRLDQGQLCERMRSLGHTTWHKQTVSEAEHGRRAIRADELFSLAAALETEPAVLLQPPAGVQAASPNGLPYAAHAGWRHDGKPAFRLLPEASSMDEALPGVIYRSPSFSAGVAAVRSQAMEPGR
jgi:transcriptional regulator with XRE-family HTH domain